MMSVLLRLLKLHSPASCDMAVERLRLGEVLSLEPVKFPATNSGTQEQLETFRESILDNVGKTRSISVRMSAEASPIGIL